MKSLALVCCVACFLVVSCASEPIPAATATPEPVPPATIPEGRVTRQFQVGSLSFAHPPGWVVSSEGAS